MKKLILKPFVLMSAGILMSAVLIGVSAFNFAYASEVVAEVVAPVTETTPVTEETAPVAETTPVVEEVTSVADTTAPAPAEEVAPASTQTASVASSLLESDKPDYAPTDMATITGSFFGALKNIFLKIVGWFPDESEKVTHISDTITTTEEGSFTYGYQLDGIYRPDYIVEAFDSLLGTLLARMTFTDSHPGHGGGLTGSYNLDQGKNGGISNTPISPVEWVNGNLNQSGAHYQEGQSVPYRVILTGLPVNVPSTVKIEWDIRQSSKNAIDYITGPQRIAETVDPTIGVTGLGPVSYSTIPTPGGTTVDAADIRSNSFAALPSDNNNNKLWAYNVTGPVTFAPYVNGSDTGANTSTSVVMTFTPSNSTVVLAWGGHIATEADWSIGNGATTLPGSPYHMRILELCNGSPSACGGGNQDRSLSASAVVVPSTITIRKATSPSSDITTSFPFTTTGTGYTGFSLTGSTFNTQSITPGSYTVTETSPLPAYANTALTCTASGTGSSATPTLGTRSVAITIGSAGGAIIDCTYTNTLQQGTLILNKVAVGGNDTFGYTVAGPTPSTPSITTIGGNGTTGSLSVNSGSYSVSESTIPSGWNLTDSVCSNGTPASFTVTAGQTTTCTFTNTKNTTLTLLKTVIIDNGGTAVDTAWTLTATGNTNISGVEGNGSVTDAVVTPGTYALGESGGPSGYSASLYSCAKNGGTPVVSNSLSLVAGDNAVCTITNDDQPGHLIVNKVTNPASDVTTQFSITASGGTIISPTATQNIVGGASVDYTVNAGTYNVSEATKAGWTETSNTCAGVVVANGATVNCTITNIQKGTIIIVKDVIGNPDPTDFTFNNNFGNGNPATFLLDEDTNATLPSTRTFEVIPGTYAVTEDPLAGWQSPESTSCDQGETVDSIDVGPGETVTCTFVNEELAKIVLVKNTVGGNGDFDFTMTGSGLAGNTSITTVANTGNKTFIDLDQDNTYSITETVPEGWDLTSATCTGTNTPSAITPDAGETVTCTFTNTKDSNIVVNKTTVGGHGEFTFDTSYGADFVLSNGQSSNSGDIDAGTYSISEAVPSGWAQTSATCDDNSPVGAISLQAGETVTCTFVNNKPVAQIDVTPLTDTNKIGDNHVITANVQVHNGNGTWGSAADGTTITFAITNSLGATAVFVPSSPNTCITTAGSCSITINSSTAGSVVVNASATPVLLGVNLPVATGTGGENSADAQKDYVNARISITPLADTNEVNDDHDFIVTVEKSVQAGVWTPVQNAIVDGDVLPATTFNEVDCTAGTDVSGQCTLTVNSATAGVFTVSAGTTISVGGVNFNLLTGSGAPNSVPAVKKYVDGYITIGQTATNNITEQHVFTVTVTQIPGTATQAVTANVTPLVVPAPDSYGTTCNATVPFVGDVATCTITINNNTPGVFDATASATFTVGGVALTRSTNGTAPNSGAAVKTYVAGALEITKIVNLGSVVNPSVINDTFTVTVTGPSYPVGTNIVFTVTNGVLQAPTSITLSPIIPGNYTITEADAGSEWTEVVPADAVTVVANATAQATVTNTYVPGSLQVNKVVQLNGYLIPTGVDLDFTINITGPSYPVSSPVVINVVDGIPTNSPQVLLNLIPGVYTVSETDPGIAWTVTGGGNVTVNAGVQAPATVTNSLKIPSTLITMTPDVFETTAGGNVILTITDTNNGAVPITSPSVQLLANDVLTVPQPTFVSESGVVNGIMDIGETWTWTWTGTISVNTVFTVNGIGTDPLGNPVNGPTYSSETTSQTVRVIGTTRTIGFWQTHTTFTSSVFGLLAMQKYVGVNLPVIGGQSKGIITNSPLAGQSELFGGFYAPIARKTDGSKRNPVDQARIQMLQQLLAAKLNCAAFGCSTTVQGQVVAADAAYLAGNKSAIMSYVSILDAFNNSGDENAIPPLLGPTGKATPKTSQGLANLIFWNLP